MAKHFLRVEVGDAETFSVGDSERTESTIYKETLYFSRADRFGSKGPSSTQSKDFVNSAHLANEISQGFARN